MDARALFQAVKSGDLLALEQALGAGADPNAADARGQRVLGVAVRAGRVQVVERLLERGADPDVSDRSGDTAVVHCMSAAADLRKRAVQARIARALRKAGTRLEIRLALWGAAIEGDLHGVDALLRDGAEVDPAGLHPLADAAQAGHVAIVERLLDAAADIERPRGRTTPLLDAAHAGHLDVVQRLVARGAQPLPEGADEDAAHAALRGKRWPVIQWLEQHTGRIARSRLGARAQPGPTAPGWPLFAQTMSDAGGYWYALVCVQAPIEEVAPAARDEVRAHRLLVGIDTEPQWLLRNERPRYLTQLRGCDWTIVLIPDGDRDVGSVGDHLARGLCRHHGWRVLSHAEDKYTEEFEVELFERGPRKHPTTHDSSVFIVERVGLPGFHATRQGVIVHGIAPDQLVRVDAYTETFGVFPPVPS